MTVTTPWALETSAVARSMTALSPSQGSPAGQGAAGIWGFSLWKLGAPESEGKHLRGRPAEMIWH